VERALEESLLLLALSIAEEAGLRREVAVVVLTGISYREL
jgi:hypothetical protein